MAGGRGQRALLRAILRAAISEPESLLDVGGRVPELTGGLFFTMLVGVPSLAGCRVLLEWLGGTGLVWRRRYPRASSSAPGRGTLVA